MTKKTPAAKSSPAKASTAKVRAATTTAKSTRGSTTTSRIGKVEGNERIDEIARMLGGAKLTDTGREHAREMLAGRPPGTDSGT
ncbi:MAG: hypothetical protein IH616_21010 [Gemmatimonadales bacterium]|nr:hypothetical protein [Gemmatimonadales bacterium]